MQTINASQFYKTWLNTVTDRKDDLLQLWHKPKEYTYYIKGSENSVVSEIATKLELLCYESDYYSLDTIFYKIEDKTPGINENTFWFHDIRIGFEHENSFSSGLYQEVSHLLITNCELKVLVTYPDREIEDELTYLHKIISSNRQAKHIAETESFLLIFGYENGFEWEGYAYTLESWSKIALTEPSVV
jgi:hypothetical protein